MSLLSWSLGMSMLCIMALSWVYGLQPDTPSSVFFFLILIFAIVWLALAVRDAVGWTCKKCGERGAWHEAHHTALADVEICPHCEEKLV